MKNVLCSLLCLCFVGCGPWVPVTDLSKVPQDKLNAAYKIKTFTTDSNLTLPEIVDYLGDITAYSCKNLLWDRPASKGNALMQLKLKGLAVGADGIIEVTFDIRGTDAWGTNCWETVQASGIAVRFREKN